MSQPEPKAEEGTKSRIRGWFMTAIKLGIAVGLFGFILERNPDLRGAVVLDVLASGSFVAVLGLAALAISLSGVRWALLLQGEGIKVPLLQILKLTWIGHFWNMVIPGAVSGDAVKMFYIGRAAPERREEAWTTVLADRVIGLGALVTLSMLAALSSLDFIQRQPELRSVVYLMLAVLTGLGVAVTLLVFGVGRESALVKYAIENLPMGGILERAYDSLSRIARRPKVVVGAFLISLFAHAIAVTNAYLLGRAAGEAILTLTQYCVVIPIGMFSNAIPISPGGLGVGETVLENLFAWSGGQGRQGVYVMLLFRVVFYVLALVGAVAYVFHKRDAKADLTSAQLDSSDGSELSSA